MQWYKHSTNSHDDPDISDAWDTYGDFGYVGFFVLLEIYGQEYRHRDSEGFLNISQTFLRRKLRKSWRKVQLLLNFFSERDRLSYREEYGRVMLKVPKFDEIASNWSRRVKFGPTEVPTEAPTAKDIEVDIEEDLKKKRTPLTPQGKLDDVQQSETKEEIPPIPEHLQDLWPDFKRMRMHKKAKLTKTAVKMVLNKLEKLAPNNLQLQRDILAQSIERAWTSVFELQKDRKSYAQVSPIHRPIKDDPMMEGFSQPN